MIFQEEKEMNRNAMIIDRKDTVAVAIEPITKGQELCWLDADGQPQSAIAQTDIPIYHKFAICEMAKGTEVMKYGEDIGLAATDIHVGEHVHVHNVENHREQL